MGRLNWGVEGTTLHGEVTDRFVRDDSLGEEGTVPRGTCARGAGVRIHRVQFCRMYGDSVPLPGASRGDLPNGGS